MIKAARCKIKCVVGDRVYDSRELYDAAKNAGAKILVPPSRTRESAREDRRTETTRSIGSRTLTDNDQKKKLVTTGKVKSRMHFSDTRRSSVGVCGREIRIPKRLKRSWRTISQSNVREWQISVGENQELNPAVRGYCFGSAEMMHRRHGSPNCQSLGPFFRSTSRSSFPRSLRFTEARFAKSFELK